MARHHPNVLMCRQLAGRLNGQVCANCEGRCILCDSQSGLNLSALICDDCAHLTHIAQCILCHAAGVADAKYCDECVALEYDRDGCPRIITQSALRVSKHFKAASAKVNVASNNFQ